MTFEEYIPEAMKTAVFTDPFYPFASLIVESAELLDVFVKPLLRGDNDGQVDLDKLIKEAGDCYWNLAAVCQHFGETSVAGFSGARAPKGVRALVCLVDKAACLAMGHRTGWRGIIADYHTLLLSILAEYNITESEVLEANLAKLRDRAARGVLKGSGGER